MALKKRGFRDLKQGNRSVIEYLQEFNPLVRYAPEEVREDEDKQKFLSGLNPELSVQLISNDSWTRVSVRKPNTRSLIVSSVARQTSRHNRGLSQKLRYTTPHHGGSSSNSQFRPAPHMQYINWPPPQQQNQVANRAPRPTPTIAAGGSASKDGNGKGPSLLQLP